MKTIANKTHGALRVPLPHGKVLHLGLNQTAHVSVHDADHPPLQKLVEEGKVELLDEAGNQSIPEPGRGKFPFEG